MTPCHDGMGVFCSRLAPLTHSYTQPEGRIACTIFKSLHDPNKPYGGLDRLGHARMRTRTLDGDQMNDESAPFEFSSRRWRVVRVFDATTERASSERFERIGGRFKCVRKPVVACIGKERRSHR